MSRFTFKMFARASIPFLIALVSNDLVGAMSRGQIIASDLWQTTFLSMPVLASVALVMAAWMFMLRRELFAENF
jgi:hypothetical protein